MKESKAQFEKKNYLCFYYGKYKKVSKNPLGYGPSLKV